jgi:hypothetical protein
LPRLRRLRSHEDQVVVGCLALTRAVREGHDSGRPRSARRRCLPQPSRASSVAAREAACARRVAAIVKQREPAAARNPIRPGAPADGAARGDRPEAMTWRLIRSFREIPPSPATDALPATITPSSDEHAARLRRAHHGGGAGRTAIQALRRFRRGRRVYPRASQPGQANDPSARATTKARPSPSRSPDSCEASWRVSSTGASSSSEPSAPWGTTTATRPHSAHLACISSCGSFIPAPAITTADLPQRDPAPHSLKRLARLILFANTRHAPASAWRSSQLCLS